MTDVRAFLQTALPWVIMGICVVILAANHKKPAKNERDEHAQGNYATEGMCLGMCFGATFCAIWNCSLGIGLSPGMLVGLVIGQTIRKKGERSEPQPQQNQTREEVISC